MSEFSGSIVTLIYSACNFVLLCVLAIAVYIVGKKTGDKLSFIKFVRRLWSLRGIYSVLIIHIYDSATDIGVLYSWYQLWQLDIDTIDMKTFFWVAVSFIIAYRFLLIWNGAFLPCLLINIKCWIKLLLSLIGIVLGALDLTIFVIIFGEQYQNIKKIRIKQKQKKLQKLQNLQKQQKHNNPHNTQPQSPQKQNQSQIQMSSSNKNNDSDDNAAIVNTMVNQTKKTNNDNLYRAGKYQKLCEFIECVLESMPEVILQTIFFILSYNDQYLKELEEKSGNNVSLLTFLSILGESVNAQHPYASVRNASVRSVYAVYTQVCFCMLAYLNHLANYQLYDVFSCI